MGTGPGEKQINQKNSPLSSNDKSKKKKKVLVRVSTWMISACCIRVTPTITK